MGRELSASKVTFFPKTADGFGQPVQLPWCVNLSTTDNYETKSTKGDGRIESSFSRLTDVDISLELSSQLPIETLCKVIGTEYQKGMMIKTTSNQSARGLLAYEIDKDGDGCRRRALLNCYLTLNERGNSTDSEGETYKFEGKAIGDANNDVEIFMDEQAVEAEADAKVKEVFDSFFTKAPHRPTVA